MQSKNILQQNSLYELFIRQKNIISTMDIIKKLILKCNLIF